MKNIKKKILSFLLCLIIIIVEAIPYPVSADNDTRHNNEAFVAGGGYIYFAGWAVAKDMRYCVQFPSSIYRTGSMYERHDLANIPNAYAYSCVIGLRSGTYSGEGNQFVLVCWTMDGNGYRVVDMAFTVTKPHVVLDKQGGSGGTDNFDVEYGDYPGNIRVPSKENCEFLGYYTQPNGRGTKYINGDGTATRTWAETGGTSNTPVTSYTLYAYWRVHFSETPLIENFIAPTCTNDGGYDKVFYCENTLDRNTTKDYYPTYTYFEEYTDIEDYEEESIPIDITETTTVTNNVCHHEMSRVHVEIPQRGHNPAEAVVESYEAATCTKVGGYDLVVYCDRDDCGEELSREHIVIPATGHQHTEIVGDKSPSFESEGFSGKLVCNDCGAILDSGHVIEKLSKDEEFNPEEVRDTLNKEIAMSEKTQNQLENLVNENQTIVLEIISCANNTISNLKEQLESGQISQQEYQKALETIENTIEACANVGSEATESKSNADKIDNKIPANFEINLAGAISDFYDNQIEALFNEDGTMDLTVTEETYKQMYDAIDTYVDQMVDTTLELKQCSGKEVVAHVNKVITAISVKTFRDFDKEAADAEFAENAYNAVVLNMQAQVKTILTKEYESAINSNKYKGTAKKQFMERYASEMAAIDDLATFELMVIETMRAKYVAIMNNRLKENTISNVEYNEFIGNAKDIETFVPVYKGIFKAWALNLEDEYGISLEELTKSTINDAKESIKPDTYKGKENNNESIPEIKNIFGLANLSINDKKNNSTNKTLFKFVSFGFNDNHLGDCINRRYL